MKENENNTLPATQEAQPLSMQNFTAIMQSAPDILRENTERADRCELRLNDLLDNEEKTGMSDELDALFAQFIEKGTATLKYTNEQRKPFTVLLDEVKKSFTGVESRLKAAIAKAQERRNAYATIKREQKEAEERAAAEKQKREMELINVRKQVEDLFNEQYHNALAAYKKSLSDLVNQATLETFNERREKAQKPYDFRMWWHELSTHEVAIKSEYATQSDLFLMRREYVEQHKVLEDAFDEECEGYRTYIDMKFDERKAELDAIAKADAEEKARLEKEAEERAAAEKERLENERKEAERKAKEQTEIEAKQRAINSQVDAQVSLFQEENKRKDKEQTDISVKTLAGYLELTMQWYEVEGKTLPAEKFEKMTFARIKTWCEKYTDKNDIKLNSDNLTYGIKVTAK